MCPSDVMSVPSTFRGMAKSLFQGLEVVHLYIDETVIGSTSLRSTWLTSSLSAVAEKKGFKINQKKNLWCGARGVFEVYDIWKGGGTGPKENWMCLEVSITTVMKRTPLVLDVLLVQQRNRERFIAYCCSASRHNHAWSRVKMDGRNQSWLLLT